MEKKQRRRQEKQEKNLQQAEDSKIKLKEVEAGKRSQDVEESLTAIFKDEQGEMPDLKILEKHRSSRLLFFFLGAASFFLVLLIATWTGFTIFKPFKGFQGQGLQITIDGPERVALGQETTYFINWQNISSDPLATADLKVSFPTDFSIVSTEPEPTDDNLNWKIGSVAFGGRGTIMVKGVFTGALGTETAIQVVGSYRPASFNSDFETLTTKQLVYADTVLEGSIEAPAKSLPGDKVKIAYKIINHGFTAVTGLEARLTIPEGFVLEPTTTSDIFEEGRMAHFKLGDLEANASTTVYMAGTFAAGVSGSQNFHTETGKIGSDGEFKPAQKSDLAVMVLSGDLSLNLVVNGSEASRSIGLGELLHVTLGYENTAIEDVRDVTLKFFVEPVYSSSVQMAAKPVPVKVVEWSNLEDSSSSTRSENTLTWTDKQIGVLKRLGPGQDGTLDFSLPVTSVFATSTDIIGFQLLAEANMVWVGETKVDRTIRTAPMLFRFKTDADLTSEARYYSEEGIQFGSGPLPPVVDQTTTYRILWTIDKTFHEIKNVKVSAVLPKQVTWVGVKDVSAGEVMYDQKNKTVTWTLNRMPSDIGEVNADFNIQLTPSQFDANRFADLLSEVRMEAKDVELDDVIVRTKPGLTTDLQNDEGAKSKGVVRKP